MRSTTQLSITLPNEMAMRVKAKVQRGEYASESEVIREGLRVLDARDQAFENWVRAEAIPALDEMKRDPSKSRSVEQVRAAIAEERERALARARTK